MSHYCGSMSTHKCDDLNYFAIADYSSLDAPLLQVCWSLRTRTAEKGLSMAIDSTPRDVFGAGEYGATTVHLTKDGDALRLAFGRNGVGGIKVIYGAVLLTSDAAAELREQLAALG